MKAIENFTCPTLFSLIDIPDSLQNLGFAKLSFTTADIDDHADKQGEDP